MANVPDRRRYTGPETSWPVPFAKVRQLPELIDETSGVRADGRKPDEARPIYLKTGLIPQANGSAYIEAGKTKIICAVYGPHPARKDAPFSPKATLSVEVKFAPFATRDRRRAPGKETEATSLSAQLSQALLPSLRLDLLPKAAIDLYLTILEADGPLNDISAGITASSVALASAGVQMYGLVIGCSANVIDFDGDEQHLFLDATYDEAGRSQGILSLACMPAMSSTTTMAFSGSMTRAQLKAATKQLQQAAVRTHAVATRALLESKQEPPANGVV